MVRGLVCRVGRDVLAGLRIEPEQGARQQRSLR